MTQPFTPTPPIPTPTPQFMVSQQMFEDHLKAWLRITIKSKVPALVQIPNLLQGSGGFWLEGSIILQPTHPEPEAQPGLAIWGWALKVLPRNKSKGASLLSYL